jgi:hypothetical protein
MNGITLARNTSPHNKFKCVTCLLSSRFSQTSHVLYVWKSWWYILYQRCHQPYPYYLTAWVKRIPDPFDKNRINISTASTLVEYETLPQTSLDALAELIARKDLGPSSWPSLQLAEWQESTPTLVVCESAGEVSRSSVKDKLLIAWRSRIVKPIISPGEWGRWSLAWSQIHRDGSGGLVADALRHKWFSGIWRFKICWCTLATEQVHKLYLPGSKSRITIGKMRL